MKDRQWPNVRDGEVRNSQMPHPLVLQLRFTRSEFIRAAKVSEEDAAKRVMPMNSISWTIGHLAWQEQRYFIYFPTGSCSFRRFRKGTRLVHPPVHPLRGRCGRLGEKSQKQPTGGWIP